ncbi:MAG: hypothetical protein ABSF57_03990 [Acidobacteriaceae bacterium]|jgi:hypothetical protein
MGQIKHNSHQRSVSMIAIAILLLAALPLCAQTPPDAPIPAQFATAKTVFISNAGAEDNGISEQAYSVLYAGLTKWNRYQIVLVPASAELVLELRYTAPLSDINVMNGSSNPPHYSPRFQLNIRDRATGVILWSVTESPFGTRKQNSYDNAVNALLADFKALSDGQYPSEAAAAAAQLTAPKKTRIADKK